MQLIQTVTEIEFSSFHFFFFLEYYHRLINNNKLKEEKKSLCYHYPRGKLVSLTDEPRYRDRYRRANKVHIVLRFDRCGGCKASSPSRNRPPERDQPFHNAI